MFNQLRPAFILLAGFTLITGLAYPLLVTGVAQLVWPRQANGSIIESNGNAVGSALIAQGFSDAKYFWPRPSSTTPAYNGAGGSGSNLAPSNPALADVVKLRAAALRAADPSNGDPIPVDLLTASGSGLDPHITPAAAEYQIGRVARARGIDAVAVRKLVRRYTEQRDLGLLGEPRVNVLELNLAIDSLAR